jgi:hypothetical protein
MENKLNKKGNYEIFKTTGDNEILRLGEDEVFAIVEINRGHILVKTDEDHEKQETIEKGQFYLMSLEEDPAFQDMPHLFIEKGAKYQELVLPSGLPDHNQDRKKIIFTREKVDEEKIRLHSKDKKQQFKNEDPVEMKKKELGRMARKLNIEGRSKMNKDQLSKAIHKAKE